jgi:WD40 repeat protein
VRIHLISSIAIISLACGAVAAETLKESEGASNDQPRLDRYGDALPEHALMRIGTLRLRTGDAAKVLSFTADAKMLVTASSKFGIQVWEVATGKEVRAFGGTSYQTAWAISEDGAWAAIASEGECRIYDTATGKSTHVIQAGWLWPHFLCFSLDKKYLACIGGQATGKYISIWNMEAGKMVQNWSIPYAPTGFSRVVFSPDSKTLAASRPDESITVWDIQTGRPVQQMPSTLQDHGYRHLAFFPNGATLLAIGWNQEIFGWEVSSGKQLPAMPIGKGHRPASFTPDGKSYITGLPGGPVQMWSLETGHLQATLHGPQNGIGQVAFSGDGKYFAAACDEDEVRIWDLKKGKQIHNFVGHAGPWVQARFTSDGKTIVSRAGGWTEEAHVFKFWDVQNGDLLRKVPWKGRAAAVSGDGLTLAVQDEKMRISNIGDNGSVRELDTIDSMISSTPMPMTADGRYLIVEKIDRASPLFSGPNNFKTTFEVWDVGDPQKLITVRPTGSDHQRCQFTDDGRYFAVFTGNWINPPEAKGVLTFWDLRTGRKVNRGAAALPVHEIGTFSPSGRLMAWQFDGGKSAIAIRELASGKLIRELQADGKDIVRQHAAPAFSPWSHRDYRDGRRRDFALGRFHRKTAGSLARPPRRR